jgi:hypothetical protein
MSHVDPATESTLPPAVTLQFPRYGILGLIICALGMVGLLVVKPVLQVDGVRLSFTDMTSKLSDIFQKRNLVVEVWTAQGCISSKTNYGAVIGNGLTIKLPKYVPHDQMKEIKVFDVGMISGTLLDRVDAPPLECDGGKYHYQLLGIGGSGTAIRSVAWACIWIGAAPAVLAMAIFVRRQAI